MSAFGGSSKNLTDLITGGRRVKREGSEDLIRRLGGNAPMRRCTGGRGGHFQYMYLAFILALPLRTQQNEWSNRTVKSQDMKRGEDVCATRLAVPRRVQRGTQAPPPRIGRVYGGEGDGGQGQKNQGRVATALTQGQRHGTTDIGSRAYWSCWSNADSGRATLLHNMPALEL